MTVAEARAAAEAAARASYGRLVAMLAARTRDIAGAEDALSGAFVAALATWPERGVPHRPEAWLLTAARNALANASRQDRVRVDAAADILSRGATDAEDPAALPDQRLALMALCAHPAIDPAIRAPLMLQTVLGLDAARIAAAFLVSPAAMGQRLVRAKAQIRAAGLAFDPPGREELPDRLADILSAVYACYGTGWDDLGVEAPGAKGITAEAMFLARLIVELVPGEPEALGLLALMLYCEARRPARRDAAGRFVPLGQQDTRLWTRGMVIEAEGLLTQGSRAGRFGRFLCEAAIQSVHVQAAVTGRVHHDGLLALYGLLVREAPSLGSRVGEAAALAAAGRPAEALGRLDALPADRVASYQPYWATRAEALAASGRPAEARTALARAIGLTEDPAVRTYLTLRSKDLPG